MESKKFSAEDDPDGGDLSETDHAIKVQLVFEHPTYKSMSIYRLTLDGTIPVMELKESLKDKLHQKPEDQLWFYKEKPLIDSWNLRDYGVRNSDYLLVRLRSGTVSLMGVT